MKKSQKKSAAKRGRPAGNDPRKPYPLVRLNREDLERIREQAREAGVGLTAWVRGRLGLEPTRYGEGSD